MEVLDLRKIKRIARCGTGGNWDAVGLRAAAAAEAKRIADIEAATIPGFEALAADYIFHFGGSVYEFCIEQTRRVVEREKAAGKAAVRDPNDPPRF